MKAQDLKNSILQLAIQGKLVEQREEEGTAKELIEKIEAEKEKLIKEKKTKKKIEANIPTDKLGKELKIKGFEVKEQKGNLIIFKEGTYNTKTGEAKYTKKELPYVLKKMTELHKSDSKHKFYLLNTIFGISLFFFVISSFWMFNPKSQIFRKGMIATAIGLALALFLTLA